METEKVRLFIRVCVMHAASGYLTGLKPEELICLYEECLVMALFLHDSILEEVIYLGLGEVYVNMHQLTKAIRYHEKCLSIARKIGDRQGVGRAYGNLGNACQLLGKYHEAIRYHERRLTIATEIGDRQGEGKAYGNLGNAYWSLGKYQDAIKYHEKSLSIATEIGDRQGERGAYGNIGSAYWSLGKYHEAINYHERSLGTAEEIGDRHGEGSACGNLGNAYQSLGKYHEAIEYHERNLIITKDIGDRQGEGKAYGNLGNAYHSLGKYHEAIKYYEKCLSLAIEIGDRRVEGTVYGNLGNAYHSLGKYQEAIKYLEMDVSIATEIGDREGEGSAYGNLGIIYLSLSQYLEAIKYLERCLSITIEISDRQGEGTAYGNLGNAYKSLGKYHDAIKYHEICLHITKEIGDRQGEANAYGGLGNAYDSLGKYYEAIKYYEKLLNIATEICDRQREGSAYGSLGNAYKALGKYHDAIKYHEKHLNIATEIGDRQREGSAYGSLGNAYQSLGKYHEAIKYHEKHLNIATEIGDRQGEGSAYGSLGNAYQSLNKYHEAIEYHERRLTIATEIGDRQGQETAYGNLGNACLSLGKYHEALKYLEGCLSIATEIADRQGEGTAYGNLGNAYMPLGQYHEANQYYEKQLIIASEIGDRQGEAVAHHNIGVCYYADSDSNADHLSKSKEHFRKTIECYELLFDDLKEKDQLKISIFDTFIKSYKILSKLCLETGETQEALLVSERGRARALGDLLSLKYSVNKEPASKSGPLKLTDVSDVIMPTSCVLFYDLPFSKKKPFLIWILAQRKPLWYVASEIPTSTEDKDVKEEEFITNFVKKSYDSMQVREGMVCEDRSLGVLDDEKRDFDKEPAVPESTQIAERETTKGNIVVEKVSAQTRCIEDHDDDADDKALESLFAALVAPVQDELIQEEIVIIPDGPLFTVPFAALKDPKTGKFLSEMKRIRLSPSLTTLKLLQESPDDHHYKSGALIVGNPEIGKVKLGGESFCNLPGAEQEAKEIATLLEVEPLIGRQATKEAVLQKLRVGVSVIHFAAHGSENGQILLAPSTSSATNSIPDEEDYILTMQEAQESGLRAQLVVLSCCHSGRGEIKAEGVVGMARAFLAAGARAVVASLWAIDDDATKEFMLKFYSHLKKGESASKSLQQAMKEMRETECYKEPKYWAAFFLIGDDVTIKT